jgi:hypothetical protein
VNTPVLGELELHDPAEVLSVRRRPQADREHDHVELLLLGLAVLDELELQVVGLGILRDGCDPGPHEPDLVFVLRAVVVLVELLAERPHVHEEDGGLHVRAVLLRDDGLLHGVHAAHAGAVLVPAVLVPRADALNERDLLRDVTVGGPQDRTHVRAGSRHDPLELDARDDVLVGAVSIFSLQARVELVEARRHYDRPDLDLQDPLLLVVVDRLGLALLSAYAAAYAPVGVDRIDQRDRLRVSDIDRLSDLRVLVVLVRRLDRALLGAAAAAGTLRGVDPESLLLHGHVEVPCLSVDDSDLCVRYQVDVVVPARRHELGRHYAHGAVVRREGLVELGHRPSDARLLLDQVHLVP